MLSVTLDRYYRTLQKRLTVRKALLCLVVFLFLFAKIILRLNECPAKETTVNNEKENTVLRFVLHGDNVDSGYLKHVMAVLNRLGYQRANYTKDFDLLWSHVYPFGELSPFDKPFFRNLQPYQKVNHFPGSGYFTNKVDLAVSQLKHVPRAFQIPSQKAQLLEHASKNPNLLFVQKSNSHRGIKILKVEDMNLDLPGTFVQEFVHNPFLIDGLKFDIGVYTVLTSVDPLRVYIYNGDVLLRFCAKEYEPFDPDDVDKYVVGDDYIPIWEVPSLMKSYNDRKFGMMETLNNYVRKIGMKPSKIWSQIEESIVAVLLAKEEKISNIMKRYKNVGNFFEMVRFDFIIDADLNVYLMEANMSPNLSSDHFRPNRLLYENVLFGLFSLVGVGKRTDYLKPSTREEEQMEVPEKGLMVFGDECSSNGCNNCGGPQCALCKHCLTPQNLRTLKHSYLEHINKADYKRIFPPKMNPKTRVEDIDLESYTPENRFMVLWFLGKCHQDRSWC
ncbi:hypothetical protein RUM43_007732 [Polyplax serrata]|uniref:Uncharacterized protein n=1 Tax=Polyplax serrata TaxID=468196 RepID=A0AAN8P2C7_POLSC